VYLRVTILLAIALASLPTTGAADPPRQLRIRVENQTGCDLTRVKVVFPAGAKYDEHTFGSLKKGAASAYYSPASAYPYAYAEAFAGHKKIVCQPYDFVGASFLKPGDYTYVLTFHPEAEYPYRLGMDLRHD